MARYAPGLSATELKRMTPEETRFIRKTVASDVKADRQLQAAFHRMKIGL